MSCTLPLDTVPAHLQYFPTANGGATLAWDLVIHTTDGQHWYVMAMQYSAVGTDRTLMRAWFNHAPFPPAQPHPWYEPIVRPFKDRALGAVDREIGGWIDKARRGEV